jgi:uncharacterized protein (DUF427 family)
VKIPGPDHPITVAPALRRARARFQNHIIADSQAALVLREADHAPVIYFPRDDVDVAFLARTRHTSHCPYKGDASYYTLSMNGEIAENVAWSYEAPYPAMAGIEGMMAFYLDRVEVYEVSEAELSDRRRQAFVDNWPTPDSNPH